MAFFSLKPLRLPATFSAFLCAVVSLLVLGLSEYGYQAFKQGTLDLTQHVEIEKRLQHVLTLVVDAETGQRGYLLSGDTTYLRPYEIAVSQITHDITLLRNYFLNDPVALEKLALVGRTVYAKLAELDITIRLRKENLIESTQAVLSTNIGKEKMDIIRDGVDSLMRYQEEQITVTKNNWFDLAGWVRTGVAVTSVLSILAFFFFARYYARVANDKAKQLNYVAQERARLNEVVDLRTLELTELARYLQNVREDEKARLARDLHDELGALLTVAKLDAATLKSKLKDQPDEIKQKFDNLMKTLNEGISLKRRIIEDLRPSALSNLGFIPALQQLIDEYKNRHDANIETHFDDVQIDEKIGLVFYRLTQEAFTNIFKYSEAKTIRVTLEKRPKDILLRVQDDGVGFDSTQSLPGHGLAGMRFRLASVQGNLEVSSALGQGTLIEAIVPIDTN